MEVVHPPAYFWSVQQNAINVWRKLSDPDVINVTQHLFNEIQSPQHVLSELLQNADDAGATRASATIVGGSLVFEHDGQDFEPEQLRALCQFGVSSKPQLHTIGFRGIGFKSVFSFGDKVYLSTPTLSLSFSSSEFIVPRWIKANELPSHTRIVIPFKSEALKSSAQQELNFWRENPTPLIFFNNIARLDIDQKPIIREHLGPGPASNSEWVRLSGNRIQNLLHAVSEELEFPEEALKEIASERRVTSVDDLNISTCRVEIILYEDSSSRLYVVLPTAVFPDVPFSSNAPFIQDPARKQIKDPTHSPTNCWLLNRVGQLAAETMLQWLQRTDRSIKERVQAYQLLPDRALSANQLTNQVSRHISQAFWKHVHGKAIVLDVEGNVSSSSLAAIPPELHRVWGAQELLRILGIEEPQLASSEIPSKAVQVLSRVERVSLYDHNEVIQAFRRTTCEVPNPGYLGLEHLWAYIYNHDPDARNAWRHGHRSMSLVPVEGESSLRPAQGVMVLGARSNLLAEELSFLARYATMVDRNWLLHLSKSGESGHGTDVDQRRCSDARTLLASLGLASPSGIDEILDNVSTNIFQNDGVDNAAAHKLAWIAARTGSQVPRDFHYRCQDGRYRRTSADLLIDLDGSLDTLLPRDWAEKHLISDSYEQGRSLSERRLWRSWVRSRGSVRAFPAPSSRKLRIDNRTKLEEFCRRRGGRIPENIPYRSNSFIINDVDFDPDLWQRWKNLAKNNPSTWPTILKHLAREQPETSAKPYQVPQSKWHPLDAGNLTAGWVLRLRDVACLTDTYGQPALPAELMRTTPHSAPLLDVERFVHGDLDRQENWWLLDLLGVRTDPSPEIPLQRLEDLSTTRGVPATRIANLYQILDRLTANLSGPDLQSVRVRFHSTPLILAENNTWYSAGSVVQSNAARIGGVLTIHPDISELGLTLWDRIGVAKQATLEQLIDSLMQMPLGEQVPEEMLPVMRDALVSNPDAIWHQCNAWLDLSGTWRNASEFKWTLRESSEAPGLFAEVRRTVADLRMIPNTSAQLAIEDTLPSILSALDRRVVNTRGDERSQQLPAWLQRLAHGLTRIPRPDSKEDQHPDVTVAQQLRESGWRQVKELAVAPHLNGRPAGPERKHLALWADKTVYVVGSSTKYHDQLVLALSASFGDSAIRRAIIACVGREPAWIDSYLAEHFTLLQPPKPPEPVVVPPIEEPEPVDPPDPDPTIVTLPPSDPDDGETHVPPTESLEEHTPPTTINDVSENEDSSQRLASSSEGYVEPDRGDDETDDDSDLEAAPPKREHILMAILNSHGFVKWPHGKLRSDSADFVEFDSELVDARVCDYSGKVLSSYWIGDTSLDQGVRVPAACWRALIDTAVQGYLILPDNKVARTFTAHPVRGLLDRTEISPTEYFVKATHRSRAEQYDLSPEAPESESEVAPVQYASPEPELATTDQDEQHQRMTEPEPGSDDILDRDTIYRRMFTRTSKRWR